MNRKKTDDKKFKNITFVINTLKQILYITLGAMKSKDTLAEQDTMIIFLSIDEARMRAEEPDEEIYTLNPKDEQIFHSNYPLFKLIVLDEGDLIFDAQYAYNETGDIRVAVLVNKTDNESTDISVVN